MSIAFFEIDPHTITGINPLNYPPPGGLSSFGVGVEDWEI